MLSTTAALVYSAEVPRKVEATSLVDCSRVVGEMEHFVIPLRSFPDQVPARTAATLGPSGPIACTLPAARCPVGEQTRVAWAALHATVAATGTVGCGSGLEITATEHQLIIGI
jgi:hypothetical protein